MDLSNFLKRSNSKEIRILIGTMLLYMVALFAAYVLCNPDVFNKYDEIELPSDQNIIYAQLRN